MMFRIIGILVVIGILIFGYREITELWEGEITPKEATGKIIKNLGEKLQEVGDHNTPSTESSKSGPTPDPDAGKGSKATFDDSKIDANKIINDLMK
jgi:hypothetical protein